MKNTAVNHPGPVTPSTTDGAPLSTTLVERKQNNFIGVWDHSVIDREKAKEIVQLFLLSTTRTQGSRALQKNERRKG